MTLRPILARAAAAAAAALLAAASSLAAADPPGLAEGRAAFQAQRYAEAAAAFEKVVAADPANAEAWFQLGVARRELKQYDRAAEALKTAIARGYPAPTATTSLAIVYSLAGDLDHAFAELDKVVGIGIQPNVLQTHPGLAAVRADARFAPLLAKAERRAHPCESDPRYAAFDFWVGDWDVYSGERKVGENRIEKILRGCMLAENWTGANGGSGKSLNYLDPVTGKWKQNWVDDGGGIVWYEGEVQGGAMHFHGENRNATGEVALARVTLEPRPDGAVHHRIEESSDGGKTWTTAFDAIYVKKGQPPPKPGG